MASLILASRDNDSVSCTRKPCNWICFHDGQHCQDVCLTSQMESIAKCVRQQLGKQFISIKLGEEAANDASAFYSHSAGVTHFQSLRPLSRSSSVKWPPFRRYANKYVWSFTFNMT